MGAAALPLKGIRALDLTRARAGPTCARQLADWGAHVIKIELPPRPGGGDGITGERHGFDFQNLHRNKRSLTLNLKAEAGRDIFLRLAKDVDVIVENYRPGVKHRLGIDYDTVREVNPRIVYGSISGFGQSGPYRDRPGVDQIAQGLGGLMSITGLPGQGPVRVGIPIADLTAGMLLAQGILLALFERERSGEGQWVHTSLLEAQIQMLDFQAARWLISGEVAPQAGNDHPTSIPTGVFPTADGHINIAASGGILWQRLCQTLGLEALLDDPDYADNELRSKNRKALNARISEVTPSRTSGEWIEVLNEAGVPCGPINTIDATFADEQVQALGIARPMPRTQLGDTHVVGQAINLARTPQPPSHRATPELGEHTDEILRGLGMDGDAIRELRDNGVI
ncbi:MAG: CoA transferase [Dehalococcoidia bacterium]|nr:CoA transferase [Dehalococcoidia bacterium]